MPSSMTHTYFGLDVYKNLRKNYQAKIKDSIEYFKLFSQGSDPFMFYHFLIGKKAKEISEIQKRMHRTKTQDFFLTTISYIYDNKLISNSEIMAYLYGYICHYFLDLYTHPFIYYKGGIFKKEDKNTYKYNGLHQEIEYGIDLYFINKKENIKAEKFKVYKEIFEVKGLTQVLRDIIKVTIEDVYSIPRASYYYEKSIWYMSKFFKLANYDPYGLKLKIYRLIDRITPNRVTKVKELSFYNQYPNINKHLNLNNKAWYCPWNKTNSYKSSFLDLYNMAMDKAIKTIEVITEMLERDSLDIKRLKMLFKDLSFCTGINCDKEVELKYFEF